MPTLVKVRKFGAKLGVIIPKRFATARKIKVGTVIDLDSLGFRSGRRRRYKISELMAKFKPEHRHGEWDIGPPVGKEIW